MQYFLGPALPTQHCHVQSLSPHHQESEQPPEMRPRKKQRRRRPLWKILQDACLEKILTLFAISLALIMRIFKDKIMIPDWESKLLSNIKAITLYSLFNKKLVEIHFEYCIVHFLLG